ncbi:hypothetical protein MIND_00921600 [Mycena indigotica]|uniref:Uncharacterized protein n=1 Tax=Mycena indigotica TaxID=2126181 RepID=A0A8H6W0B3_9AGAR|nr:uncharacterized protein MIND_00921600 [Mycena indigotica]KAF7296898.1 hypothetical protein MIND_00921600 [Mycena indigotica]
MNKSRLSFPPSPALPALSCTQRTLAFAFVALNLPPPQPPPSSLQGPLPLALSIIAMDQFSTTSTMPLDIEVSFLALPGSNPQLVAACSVTTQTHAQEDAERESESALYAMYLACGGAVDQNGVPIDADSASGNFSYTCIIA